MKYFILLLLLSGCARLIVTKPDNTKIEVIVIGSTKIKDLSYFKDSNDITIKVNTVTNTPEGVPEVIKEAGNTTTNIMTGGASGIVRDITVRDILD